MCINYSLKLRPFRAYYTRIILILSFAYYSQLFRYNWRRPSHGARYTRTVDTQSKWRGNRELLGKIILLSYRKLFTNEHCKLLESRIVTVNMVVSHVRCIVRGVSKGFRKPPWVEHVCTVYYYNYKPADSFCYLHIQMYFCITTGCTAHTRA